MRTLSALFGLALTLLLLPGIAAAATYYVDSAAGSDSNSGLTEEEAWQSLTMVNSTVLGPGDSVLLKAGSTYEGKLAPQGSGSAEEPILIDMYDTGDKPFIDGAGYLAAVHILDQSHIEVHNLRLTSNGGAALEDRADEERYGVLVEASTAEPKTDILLQGLEIHDIYATQSVESNSPGVNPSSNRGMGIRISSAYWIQPQLSDVRVEGCSIERTGHTGITMTSSWRTDPEPVKITGVQIIDNQFEDIGGPGIVPMRVADLVVRGNTIDRSGSTLDPRMHGRGSGIWPWHSDNVLIEQNAFMHARGREDSCGAHIDIGNTDVVIQHNLSLDNEGGFIEILGDNQRSIYRYNVSINDGGRVADSDAGINDGRLIRMSSWAGTPDANTGLASTHTYIYNNTIYVSEEIASGFAFTEMVDGVVFVNNILHVLGSSFDDRTPWHDALDEDSWSPLDVVFENNLYVQADTLPETLYLQDAAPLLGDAGFLSPGSSDPADYAPGNWELVQDQGLEVTPLPGDELTEAAGLLIATDYLGNPVEGLPDLGAIEYSKPDPGDDDDSAGDDDDSAGDDDDDSAGDDDDSAGDGPDEGCGGCGVSSSAPTAWLWLLGLGLIARRSRSRE